jgi:hypothetical protein
MGRERRKTMKKKQTMRPWMVHENQNCKRKEVIQMKKREGLRSWMCTMVIAVVVLAVSLFLVQGAAAVTYKISISVVGGNGSIAVGTQSTTTSKNVTVTGGTGTQAIVTMKPNTNYCIATLTVDGNLVQPARTCRWAPVNSNHTVIVTFAPDSDNDGISNALEDSGITLYGGTSIPGTSSGLPRAERLDKNCKDLFVILAQATPSKLPANPLDALEFVRKPRSQGGLGEEAGQCTSTGITFHVIPQAQTQGDRFLNSNTAQKAVRITESLDISNPEVLGSSTCGIPDQDMGTVYTKRIENHVNSVYGVATPPSGLIDTYIKHTIAHEFAHMVGPLAPTGSTSFGGYHYQSQPNDKIMNQFVYYDVGPPLFIGTSFTSGDQGAVKLK